MKYGARRAPIWQTSKKTPETRQPRVLHSRTMRNSWISVMQLALGTEARRDAFAVDEGWSRSAVSQPRWRNIPVRLVAQHALGNLIQSIELLAKARSILSRRSSADLGARWGIREPKHPRRILADELACYTRTIHVHTYNRSQVISARVTLAERIVPLRGALKNKSNRRDGDGDSGRLSIHRRYAISSGVTTTENDEDRAERNERNIPDGLYVHGCFR